MKKHKSKILISLAITLLACILLLNYYSPRLIVDVNGGIFALIKKDSKNNIEKPLDLSLTTEKISVTTNDSLKIKCLIVKSNTTEQKGTLILVHGIRGNKEHFIPMVWKLADKGFNSVLVDLRAHGESEGTFCTYGFKEKYDMVDIVNYLHSRNDLNQNIGIWGQSLGAAVSLQAMGICKDIKFGIIESTFSDFDTIVHNYFDFFIGFDIPWLTEYFIWRAKHIANFNPDEVKPCNYCENITQPIIIAHGDMDKRININNGRINYQHITSTDKQFIEVKNATHLNLWQVGGKKYLDQVFEFLVNQAKKD